MSSTFYMDGCLSPEQSTEYFEMIFNSVQQIIELDNIMQHALEEHLLAEEDLDSDLEEIIDINILFKAHKNLLEKISSLKIELSKIPLYKSDNEILESYKEFLKTYSIILEEKYPIVFQIMEKEEVSSTEIDYFNSLLQGINKELDFTLSDFYFKAEEFGEKHDIDIS